MKLLTKHSDYAIRALVALAQAREEGQGYVSSAELGGREQIPVYFLRRILSKLLQAGFIHTREGIGGGARLAKDPAKIRVADIIELLQGKIQLSECMFRKRLCANRNRCILRHKIQHIEAMVSAEFSRMTIAGLCAEIKGANHEEKDHRDKRR